MHHVGVPRLELHELSGGRHRGAPRVIPRPRPPLALRSPLFSPGLPRAGQRLPCCELAGAARAGAGGAALAVGRPPRAVGGEKGWCVGGVGGGSAQRTGGRGCAMRVRHCAWRGHRATCCLLQPGVYWLQALPACQARCTHPRQPPPIITPSRLLLRLPRPHCCVATAPPHHHGSSNGSSSAAAKTGRACARCLALPCAATVAAGAAGQPVQQRGEWGARACEGCGWAHERRRCRSTAAPPSRRSAPRRACLRAPAGRGRVRAAACGVPRGPGLGD